MIQDKTARTNYPVIPVIANRWSPLAYSDKPVEKEKVMSLLEAARWAPSSFNEQPWSYVVGYKGDETHAKLADCLNEGNSWAKGAGVLMLSVAKTFFDHKHKPNRHYMHDTGCAGGFMFLQATEMNLYMHQMAGYDLERARKSFGIPEDFEPAAMIAIGYPGDHDALPDELKEREQSPRSRKSTEDLIWKVPAAEPVVESA